MVSTSRTAEPTTVSVQASPGAKSALGSRVEVTRLLVRVKVLVPLTLQERVKAPAAAVTGSEKVTVTFEPSATAALPVAGEVDTTVGAASVGGATVDGVGAEAADGVDGEAVPLDGGVEGVVGDGVAGLDRALRRSVLSAVEVRPVPHSVPGSKPTWPMTSMTTEFLRRTTASLPFQLALPLRWSETAAMAALAEELE